MEVSPSDEPVKLTGGKIHQASDGKNTHIETANETPLSEVILECLGDFKLLNASAALSIIAGTRSQFFVG
jgi:hypothetical protein